MRARALLPRITRVPPLGWEALFSGLASAVFVWLVVQYWPFTVDDAYITFRYSAHLAAGFGPEWNLEGARAEGYTTFLWMVAMAVPHALGLSVLAFSKTTGVALTFGLLALSGGLAHALARGLPDRSRVAAATCAVVMLAVMPATAVHAVSGMETALFTLLVTAVLGGSILVTDAHSPRGMVGLPLVYLLAGLTRPEGNLVALVCGCAVFARLDAHTRRTWLKSILAIYVLPGALYFVWRARHYGHLFPLSFYVKAQHQGLMAGRNDALEFLADVTANRFYVFVPLLAGAIYCRARIAPALAACFALFVFFAFPAHIMAFDQRYLFPILPFLFAVTACGLGQIHAAWLARAVSRNAARPALYGAVLAIFVAGYVTGVDASFRDKLGYGRGIEKAHVALALALRNVTREVARPLIALVDAGAIPYVSEWTTIDTFGLNDAHIAVSGSRDPAYALDQNPEVLVLLSSDAHAFKPHLDWEQAFYDEAKARGYVDVRTYEFTPDYHLWVMARDKSPTIAAFTR